MQITLSEKERLLLEDQKSHEQICIEKYANYASKAKDSQLKDIFNANGKDEQTHLDSINQLLSGTVPQMNQQQNQSSAQTAGSNTSTSSTATALDLNDADMCSDILMAEKYVSGTYDTTIFECKDTEVRDALNHIQKEEQKHGEAVFKYMQSKGMYNVK
ncbi:spore coat protein [Clostridium arbusti]|jgi:spore coat protein CotF|uniref:spore coat protein n=1 Tax=Clostridium arbusti TaxID=1137848 RepID=UPI0002890EC8|nr:spore coat protein [Clostridium arbusti]